MERRSAYTKHRWASWPTRCATSTTCAPEIGLDWLLEGALVLSSSDASITGTCSIRSSCKWRFTCNKKLQH